MIVDIMLSQFTPFNLILINLYTLNFIEHR